MQRYITLKNNKVVMVRTGQDIVPGEIESDKGELGEVLMADGVFEKTPAPEPAKPVLADEILAVKQLLQIIETKLTAIEIQNK